MRLDFRSFDINSPPFLLKVLVVLLLNGRRVHGYMEREYLLFFRQSHLVFIGFFATTLHVYLIAFLFGNMNERISFEYCARKIKYLCVLVDYKIF